MRLEVDVLEGGEGNILRAVDGLGDGAVDVGLQRRLHQKVLAGRKVTGLDERVGQGCRGAELAAKERVRAILDLLLVGGAAFAEHAAPVEKIEHRLDAAGDVAGQQRDGPRGRDRGETAVADAVAANRLAGGRGEFCDVGAFEKALRVIEREGALLGGELGARQVGGVLDRCHPASGERGRLLGAVPDAAKDQRVGEAGDAQPDAALRQRFLALGCKRVVRDVDHVVEEAHGDPHARLELGQIERRAVGEGMLDQVCQVDGTQEAGAVRGQWLLAARIGRVDLLAIAQVVARVDAVDEDDARLGEIVGRLHDALPQRGRGQRAVDLAGELELPGAVLAHGCEEGVRHQHR